MERKSIYLVQRNYYKSLFYVEEIYVSAYFSCVKINRL